MLKLTHVEDYLELIAGHRNVKTGKLDATSINYMLGMVESPVSLARYDVNVITNMVQGISNNTGLTAKQSALACKLILKYERQWTKLGVDISPVRDPVYRIPLRKMDYSCALTISESGDHLAVRFPFNPDRVNEIRDFSKNSQGMVFWNRDARVWQAALTEFNVNWLVVWAQSHGFEISSAVMSVYQNILNAESQERPLELTLSQNGDDLCITQAPDSVLEYFAHQNIPLHVSDLLTVLGKCADLGITVSDAVLSLAHEQFPDITDVQWNLCLSRESKTPDRSRISDILDYADRLQKWPVVIYEPDGIYQLWDTLTERYGRDMHQVAYLQNSMHPVNDQTRYIYTTRPVTDMDRIPLLINGSGMNFNADRMMMLQNSEKIVYTAQEVYKKAGHNDNTEVHFLAG